MIYLEESELLNSLIYNSHEIGLPVVDVDIFIRPYSKTFLGRYFPVSNKSKEKAKIYIYPYKTVNSLMDYSIIFETLVHEMCHHIQYKDPNFVRIKGVMHNPAFWNLYNYYIEKSKDFNLSEVYGNA